MASLQIPITWTPSPALACHCIYIYIYIALLICPFSAAHHYPALHSYSSNFLRTVSEPSYRHVYTMIFPLTYQQLMVNSFGYLT